MSPQSNGVKPLRFAAFRPVMIGLLLLFDAGVVALLGIGRHKGWLPPFVGFGVVLVGLIWLMGWSVLHRHDDDRAG